MEEKNNQKKKITLDDLAVMVQGGFIELKTEMAGLASEIKEVKSDTEEIKKELIKKVDIFTHNDLKYRVEKLEKKFA